MGVLVAIAAAVPTHARADDLLAAGDADNVWIVKPSADGKRFAILNNSGLDEPGQLSRVLTMTGSLTPRGIASADERLWMVFQPANPGAPALVQSLQVKVDATSHVPRTVKKVQPGLPPGIRLRALAASDTGPWALITIEDQDTLRQIDQPADKADGAPSVPPVAPARTDAAETDLRADTPPLRSSIPVDRLIRLRRNRWEKFDLPDDWPHGADAWVVLHKPSDAHPTLITAPLATQHDLIEVFDYADTGWTKHQHTLVASDIEPDKPPTARNAFAVDGQLVFARHDPTPNRLTVTTHLLLEDTAPAYGHLSIDAPPDQPWAVIPAGQTIALLTADPAGIITWTRMNLQDRTLHEPVALDQPRFKPLAVVANYVVLVAVLALATLTMFIFWRRDPTWNRLDLPESLILADLSRRAIAAAIDIAPGALLAMYLFQVDPVELSRRWPGQSESWRDMIPGMVVMGIYITHTLLSELFTATTLGKKVLGLHTVRLTGQPPNLWQVVARNVTKAFDLIAFPLLILPLIGPYRQRLGDLVAGTVVVTATPTDLEEPDDDE